MIKYIAIGKYYRHLLGFLKSRYGSSDSYTKGQVKSTVYECNFNKKHLPYAYALILSQGDLNSVLAEEYPSLSAEKLRVYLANRFFNGNLEYTIKNISISKVGNSGDSSYQEGAE